jgi:hypothetical protein
VAFLKKNHEKDLSLWLTAVAKLLNRLQAAVCQPANSITACGYHKSMVYYSRTLADSCRRDKLFSSGDSPRTLSSILSGEGFDEGNKENRR